jgi:hypothetical protein
VEQRIKVALEKRTRYIAKSSSSSFSSSIQLDDGLLPSGNNSFIVSIEANLSKSLCYNSSNYKRANTSNLSTVHADDDLLSTDSFIALPLDKEVHNSLLTQ